MDVQKWWVILKVKTDAAGGGIHSVTRCCTSAVFCIAAAAAADLFIVHALGALHT